MSDLSNERHLFLVNADQDEEYLRWWQAVHIPEVVANVPGIVSGQVFQLSPVQVSQGGTALRRYLAAYEIEGDPAVAVDALLEARSQGKLTPGPSTGRGPSATGVFEPLIAKLTSAGS